MRKDKERLTGYVRKVQEDSQRLTHDLLAENEKLRGIIASLDSEKSRLESHSRILQEELERSRSEHGQLQQRLASIEEENRQFLDRYIEVEQQSSNLANLYVSSYRLHGTMDREEVLAIIQEIIINLIGSEELAIFELEPESGRLRLIASFGINPSEQENIVLGSGVIGRAAQSGEMFIAEQHVDQNLKPEEAALTVCIPLKVDGRVIGAIAVFRLLSHKPALEAIDHELFDLLATHAATALYCTSIYSKMSERAELAV
jgi:GAF domain-containing protein